jgi:hypothetical protein
LHPIQPGARTQSLGQREQAILGIFDRAVHPIARPWILSIRYQIDVARQTVATEAPLGRDHTSQRRDGIRFQQVRGDQKVREEIGAGIRVVPQSIVVVDAFGQQAGLRVDPATPALEDAEGPDPGLGGENTAQPGCAEGITAGPQPILLVHQVRPRIDASRPGGRAEL